VAFNIFLCFFLRMRLRRFLIRDPMSVGTLAARGSGRHTRSSSQAPSGVAVDRAQFPMAEGWGVAMVEEGETEQCASGAGLPTLSR
jgi:hypothetical protein